MCFILPFFRRSIKNHGGHNSLLGRCATVVGHRKTLDDHGLEWKPSNGGSSKRMGIVGRTGSASGERGSIQSPRCGYVVKSMWMFHWQDNRYKCGSFYFLHCIRSTCHNWSKEACGYVHKPAVATGGCVFVMLIDVVSSRNSRTWIYSFSRSKRIKW